MNISMKTPATPSQSTDDQQLIQQARNCMQAQSHLCDCQDTIDVAVDHDHIVVSGRVNSFLLKQMVQTSLRKMPLPVENKVRVLDDFDLFEDDTD